MTLVMYVLMYVSAYAWVRVQLVMSGYVTSLALSITCHITCVFCMCVRGMSVCVCDKDVCVSHCHSCANSPCHPSTLTIRK